MHAHSGGRAVGVRTMGASARKSKATGSHPLPNRYPAAAGWGDKNAIFVKHDVATWLLLEADGTVRAQ